LLDNAVVKHGYPGPVSLVARAEDSGVQTQLSRDRVMENKPFYVLVSRPCPTA
jgi:hypothetical protein